MLQRIDGKLVEVVEFDEMPQLPITGMTPEEAAYWRLTNQYGALAHVFPPHQGWTYARALTDAIETGIITKPGKYAVHWSNPGTADYEIYEIV